MLDLGYLGLRVRAEVSVRRYGMVAATADSPLGFPRKYHFSSPDLAAFNRARVWLHFDPMSSPVEAVVTLRDRFEDTPAGTVIARRVPCLNAAAEMVRDDAGIWGIRFADGVGNTIKARRLARLAVRRELRALSLDGARIAAISQISAPDVDINELGIGTVETATAAADEALATAEEKRTPRIMSRLELVAS
jgi:hypothetical protein